MFDGAVPTNSKDIILKCGIDEPLVSSDRLRQLMLANAYSGLQTEIDETFQDYAVRGFSDEYAHAAKMIDSLIRKGGVHGCMLMHRGEQYGAMSFRLEPEPKVVQIQGLSPQKRELRSLENIRMPFHMPSLLLQVIWEELRISGYAHLYVGPEGKWADHVTQGQWERSYQNPALRLGGIPSGEREMVIRA